MNHPLIDRYQEQFVTLTAFGHKHPDVLPARRARHIIANLETQPEQLRKVFRKRFGRWFVHIPSLVEYLEEGAPLLSGDAA